MKAKAFQIHWHNKQPIYSVDFHPTNPNKLATCGGDNNVRIWSVVPGNLSEEASATDKAQIRVEYLATLTKHMKSVNCVRFSPSGEYLASAGDGGFVILWKQSETAPIQYNKAFGDEDESDEDDTDRKEFWTVAHQFRAMDGEDVYDLAWSPDGSQLIIGLTDNTAQVWDTQQAKCVKVLKDHQHFVQGVAWDPLDQLLVTQSSDRSVKVWAMRSNPKGGFNYHSLAKYSKLEAVNPDEQMDDSSAAHSAYSMFHDETLVSFFRRPIFSPDGSVLVMPAGQKTPLIASASPNRHGIYLNMRNNLHKTPTVFIGGFEKAAISIRFNPKLFPLIEGGPDAYISLPYRMVFAIVTQNSVYIFDTQNKSPLFMFANLHYASLTDVSWSCDGLKLVASSVDGFCTVSEFEPKTDFLGEALPETEALAYFKEALEVVKSIPFFNPPIPQPRKQHQAISNLENQSNSSFITLSSDLDIMIDNDGDDESRHENDENKEDFNDRNDISNLTKPVTEAVPVIIHNPPVKRRIAPTLLSSSVQKE